MKGAADDSLRAVRVSVELSGRELDLVPLNLDVGECTRVGEEVLIDIAG